LSQSDAVRIQKFLSAAGHCSRRQAERLVAQGRVTINGKPAETGAPVVPGEDMVKVDGELITVDVQPVYIALHKPVNVITSLDDPEGRPTVRDMLPKNIPRCWPVGRLDWDSEGLVLMTNDGALTHGLTHPSTHVEKLYNIKLRGRLSSDNAGLQKMREGVTLEDGFMASSSEVTVESSTGLHTWVQVILHEGHNRQLRQMAEAVGHTVLKLRRIAIGSLALDGMPPRRWRVLNRAHVLQLYADAGLKPPNSITSLNEGPIEYEKKDPKPNRAPGGRPDGKPGRPSKSSKKGGKHGVPESRPPQRRRGGKPDFTERPKKRKPPQ
jgi:23S rRNA pseudouridine2605 synthase